MDATRHTMQRAYVSAIITELRFINEFLETGLQMIPNSDTEGYNSEQDYEFSQFVTERLKKFYALYRAMPPQLVGDKEW